VPEEPVLTATRRGHGWWWAGAALAAVVAVVLLVILVRGEADDPGTATATTQAPGADMDALRVQAIAAVQRWNEASGQLDATADASHIDGVYVPGNEFDKFERAEADRRRKSGRIFEARRDAKEFEVVELNQATARIAATITHSRGVTRDSKTRKVLSRQRGYSRRLEVRLERLENKWLVSTVVALGEPSFTDEG
jgi:hypothetical protein